MDNFNITKDTKFWIYVTTIKLWNDLQNHLENSNDMYISTFKYSYIESGDIIIIYAKDKISSTKTGFVCIVQTKSKQIDNSLRKIKIFLDKNLNNYCYQLETIIFLPTLIKIDDIIPYINTIDSFKNKRSFTINHLKYDSVFNKIDQNMGRELVKSFFELNPDSVSFEDNQEKQHSENTSESYENINIDNKINDNSNKTQNVYDEIIQDTGNVPILIVLCKDSLNKLIMNPDNESNILFDHLLNCNICDVTDNDNIKTKLLNLWKDADISYLEVDSDQNDYTVALDHYYNLKKHNPFGDIDKPNIRLLNIIEQNNIYNNCMIIESYFPETKKIIPPTSKSKKILVSAKKKKKN